MSVSEMQKILNVYTDKDLETFLDDSRSFTKFEANLNFKLDKDTLTLKVKDNESDLKLQKEDNDYWGGRSGLQDLFRFIIAKYTSDDGKTVPNGVVKFCIDIPNSAPRSDETFTFHLDSDKFKAPLVMRGNSKQFLGTGFNTLKVELIKHYNEENSQKDWVTPKNIDIKLTISRNTDENYRREYFYLNTLQAPSIKDYIHRVFNPEIKDKSYSGRGYSNHRSRHYDNHFVGDLKQALYKQYKDNIVFLLEYLYGVKINITSPMDDVVKALENIPRTDLGLLEVDKVRNLLSIIKDTHKIVGLHNRLKTLGVMPATDLKRWTRKLKKQATEDGIQF